eukprot:9186777-Pyramimonas_sp.AAC.1
MRWVYFDGGWRHWCEICQEPVDDTQHILSDKHYEMSVARYQVQVHRPPVLPEHGRAWDNVSRVPPLDPIPDHRR